MTCSSQIPHEYITERNKERYLAHFANCFCSLSPYISIFRSCLMKSSSSILQTTPLILSGWTVACLTELLSYQLNIHNWPNNTGEGTREQLAVKSADSHRPWLLRECEMPKPDCSPVPWGQQRSRTALTNTDASKAMWQDFTQEHLLACAALLGDYPRAPHPLHHLQQRHKLWHKLWREW